MDKKYYKIYISIGFLIGVMSFPSFCVAQDFTLEIYRHEAVGGRTNIWRVSSKMLAKVPKWILGTKPPLRLDQAVEIARTNVISGAGAGDFWIDEITLRPVIPAGAGPFGNVYYYNICFGEISYVGHYRRCIVLMDGTVVKPGWLGAEPKIIEPWYYEE